MSKLRLPRPGGPTTGLLTLLLFFILLLAMRGQLDIFFSRSNLQTLLHKNSINAVAALGMLLLIVSGGIDLSLGSVLALVTVMAMQAFRLVYNGPEHAFPTWLVEYLRERDQLWDGSESALWASVAALTAGVGVAILCGLANGLVVTRLKVAPFVATLGMLSVARGLALWLAGRTRISFRGARPDWVDSLSRTGSDTLFFDPGVWSVVILATLTFVFLRYTVLGRYCYAIGANESTARHCGIPVERTKLILYGLAGLFTGWAGILLFAHGNGGDPNAAVGLELEVIAAVVIGGASLSGGVGTVQGTMLGVLILGLLENGVSFFGATVEMKYILIGVVFTTTIALSGWQRR